MKNIKFVNFVRNLVPLVLKQTSSLLSVRSVFAVLLFIILHLTFNTEHCICQWTWQNPLPQGNTLHTLRLKSSNELISAGDCGTIIRTTNLGNNWIVVNKISGISDDFKSYFQYSSNVIFIGSDSGKIFKSTDGGLNFVSYNINLNNTVHRIQMLDLNTGFACANNNLYKTTNGGINWNLLLSSSSGFLNSMFFFDENNGLATCISLVSSPILKRTSNGGVNWIDSIFYGSEVRIEKTLGSSIAIAYHSGEILKTTNRGLTWNVVNPYNLIFLGKLFVLNENNFFGMQDNNFYVSTNGGVNWIQKVFPEFFSGNTDAIDFYDTMTGYILGWNNKIFYTSNAGDNWTVLTNQTGNGTASTWLKDYSFIDGNTGYICGWNRTILKTTNSGDSWNSYTTPFFGHTNGICFINSNTGFAVGGGSGAGYVAKTTNSGANWFVTDTMAAYMLEKVRFFNAYTGISTCHYGELFRTTNQGENWVLNQTSMTFGMYGVHILNANTGFVAGNVNNALKKIYKTTNAGANWFEVFESYGVNSGYSNFKFINTFTGYCVGYGLIKTTNSGTNWFQVNAPTTDFCTGMEIINDTVMYVTSYGVVYKSTNGGNNWGYLDIPTNERIEFAKFFNANTGIIAGYNSIILKTTNGGGNFTSDVKFIKEIVPQSYSLEQNYPNPFNSSTNIKFSVPRSLSRFYQERGVGGRIVTIKIFDLLGREIKTLVNEKLQPGTYEVRFDAKDLPSGIYFYRMEVENFTSTKKLILLK